MRKPGFLVKLKKEGKLELVEPSEDICSSYLEKADKCLKSAKLLLQNDLYENSVSMSYYAMYNSLTALLFKTGIKCKDHSGSIILLKKVFGETRLYKSISSAKKERIDKQYYVTSKQDFVLTKSSAVDMLEKAEDFLVKMKLIMNNLNLESISEKRTRFEFVTGEKHD